MSLISNGIKRRAVYRFKCSGVCGKRKTTFVYERARDRVCLTCAKLSIPVQQESLFDSPKIVKEVIVNGVVVQQVMGEAEVLDRGDLIGVEPFSKPTDNPIQVDTRHI